MAAGPAAACHVAADAVQRDAGFVMALPVVQACVMLLVIAAVALFTSCCPVEPLKQYLPRLRCLQSSSIGDAGNKPSSVDLTGSCHLVGVLTTTLPLVL